ncbi:MAG: EAL domain-containing protein [Gammaproteobacteria bacterium]|nr:EAL domain-containing protein [Gammaproteobacteria bacterium]MBU1506296.1 EAL domain-containing protein [Gammaproteobacteria bacterium]MBU2123425.1 EAL domain-containing protein [Gammaproteobacteria bacterium]MBU2169308.1 EAL domain-containing protein [Gammaproteobacteria bacterium]MBU2201459.1 EAL domain-containing protein [Gammaproteobacteria bacterium]
MRTGNLSTWLLRGTYPRLYLPIVLIILIVTVVRYHYLLAAETDEVRRHAATELQRAGNHLLPLLAALPPTATIDATEIATVLREGAANLGSSLQSLKWQAGDQPAVEVTPALPADTATAPPWFVDWVGLAPPVQQFAQTAPDRPNARLTVTLRTEPMVREIWSTVIVQARISALNIVTILVLLTLLLRANARMLRRLAEATDAFRQGRLDTRMHETGTLESRAMAATFNDMAGKVQSLVLSLRDTQQMQSEQLHFTRQLIDALPLPVFVRNANGSYLDANRAWQQLFGASPSTAASRAGTSAPAYPEELSSERSAQIAHAQDNEIRIQRAHQAPLYMAYYEAPFTSTSGALAGTIGTLVDVTERKRAQEALHAEKERAEVTLASIGDGVITTDLAGRIESINEAAQLMTGFTAEQATGLQLDSVFRLYEEPASRTASAASDRDSQTGALKQATYEVLIHRSGERYAIEYTASAIRKGDGMAVGCVLVFRDVTETRNLRHQISWHARHDALTGLYNRAALAERLTHAIFVARNKGLLLAVCMLDLDHFQTVNDTYGNRVGDRLLKETARRLEAFATPRDAVARMGGDEFVLLLGEQADVPAIKARVAVLMEQLAAPYAIDDRVLHTTVSIGVAVFPQDDANPDTLLRHADQAMCQAKSFGRNQMHVFDVQLDHAVQTQHTRQTRIAQALHRGELVLHYQPKVNLRTGEILGLEALLRWQHPEFGLLGPQHLLPLIEDNDLVVELGEWVLRQALAQMRQWTDAGMLWEISVNVAAPHFHRPNFVQRLKDILHTCPEVSPTRLELEILESAALEDMQYMRRMMQSCQALGVRFALDDFGTGFSSLSYLKRLPAETIKIDQSFVRGILEDGDDLTLVSAIVALAAAFNRHVVAEGVETQEQCAKLLELGCERAQGFGIARPMPAQEVMGWAARHTALQTPTGPSSTTLTARKTAV